MIRLAWLFLAVVPAWGNLYFFMPVTEVLKVGEFVLDTGAAYSFFDHPDVGEEDRYYLPDMTLTTQIAPRFSLHANYFGIYRSNSVLPATEDQDGFDFTFGDLSLGGALDLWRNNRGSVVKAFATVKIPNADNVEFFGSDRTDVFLGGSLAVHRERFRLDALLRLDILGRPENAIDGQWDYITASVRGDWLFGPHAGITGEVWHRTRSTDSTTLTSLGLWARLGPRWNLRFLYGEATNDHYVPSLDSMLERQVSLRFVRRWESARWRNWLNN